MHEVNFRNAVWYWRGPAPYFFVPVPEQTCPVLHEASEEVSYGWGMIPANATIGATTWYTALWPKDGGYLVPLKTWVRQAEGIDEGDVVDVRLQVARRDQLTDRPAT